MPLTKHQEDEIQALRDRLMEAGMSQAYIERMVDIKTKHYEGLGEDETIELNQMDPSNIQNEDEIFDTGTNNKKNTFAEAQKQHDLAIDEAPTAAATDFENYKKQNKDRTSSVYSGKGEFKTVLSDGSYELEGYIENLNSDMTVEHLQKNDYIQKEVWPSIMNANAGIIDKKASELIEKYGITSETSPNDPKYIQAQKEMDILQSKLFYNDKRVQDVATNYHNELQRLHGIDKAGYMVDKYTKPWIKDLDLKWNVEGLPLSPMSLYNSVFSAGTDIKSVGAAGQAGEYQKRYNRYQSNLKLATKNKWEDDQVGYENEHGDFTHRKDAYSMAAGFNKKTTWGEHKEKMSKTITDNEKTYKEDLAKILKRRDISSHYERADFDKFASGDNSLRELSLMLTEQGFNMIGAMATLGSLPSIMEGASIYETRVEDRAKEMFGLDDVEWAGLNEQEKLDYLYQAVLSDTENKDGEVAANTGFAIGLAETASSAFVLGKTGLLMKKGYGSLVKGQYKRFLKNTMKTGGAMVAGGFGESLVEGFQTTLSSAATGHWSWDEFRQAMGTGAVVGTLIPGGGNVVSSTIQETKAAAQSIASKWDKNSVENILNSHQKELDLALKNGSISKEEHEEKSNIINDTRRSNEKIPSDFNVKNKKEAVDLLTEKIKLQREVDKIEDKALAKGKQNKIAEIDEKLEQVALRDEFEKQQEVVEKEAGRIFGEGVQLKNITSEEAIAIARQRYQAAYKDINERLKNKKISKQEKQDLLEDKAMIEEQIEDAGGSFGFYDADNKTMYLNKEASIKQGFVTTGSHEFLHAILQNTLKQDPSIAVDLGNALGQYLEKIDVNQIADSEYAARVSQYQNAPSNVQGEEMITLLSEAIQRGDIKFNESAFTKVKDILRRFLQKIGLKEIEFNTGEDVYNFIKDYSKAIQSGRLDQSIKNLALKGATGKLIKPSPTDTKDAELKLSKNAADKVNQLYEEKGVDADGEIAMEYQGMANKMFERNLAMAPSEDIRNNLISNKDLIVSDLLYDPGTETAKGRTVLGLVRDYPDYVKRQEKRGEKVAPLSGFINNMLPTRAKKVFGEYGVEMALTKSMEQEGIAREAEGTGTGTVVLPNLKKQKEFMGIKVYEKLGTGDKRVRDLIDSYQEKTKGIAKKMSVDQVENTKFKDVEDLAPEITAEIFGIDAAKLTRGNPKFGHNLRKDDKRGTNEQRSAQMLAAKNPAALKLVLPKHHTTKLVKDRKTGEMVERPHEAIKIPTSILQEYYTKGKRVGNLTPWYLKDLTDKEFLEPLGVIDKKSFRDDRRKSQQRLLALAQLAGKTMSYQAIKEQKLDEGVPLNVLKTISDGANPLVFSKNIAKIKDPEEKAILYTKLPEIYDTYINHGKSMESTFNILFPDMFGLNRKNLIKDFENYVQTYEQAEQIAKETGIPIEKTIEEYITEETQEMDLAANMRGLMGLGKGSIDFRNKEQLQSVRNAVVKIAHKLGWEKADRFLSFLYASGKIGGTRLINDGKGGLEIDPDFEIKKLAKGKTPKETESIRYGIFGGVADFKQVVLTGLDGWTEDSKGTILSDAKQSVDVDVSTPALAKVNKDSANRNKEFLVELMDISSELIADGKMSKNDLGMIMMSLSGDMRTPLAAAAHVSHTTSGPISTKTHRYEHVLPRKIVGLYLADYAVGKTNKTDVNKLLNQFSVAIIPKVQDDIVNAAGYKDSMPKDWILGSSLLKRYFNIKTFGKINLPLIDVTTGEIDTKSQAFADAYNTINKDHENNTKFKKALLLSKSVNKPKGITVLDFDDTLATTKSLVRFTAPDGTTGTLNAEEYASTYQDLLEQGYTFDFSEFNKVVKGKIAPLFQKALKLQGKFGPKNMFVLTARPPAAQKAIFDFLKANGLNIPLENITGLGNSTSEAKALWIADKVGEGYNDFYFADDALQNVQAVKNMLDQFDVKSKVQQAKLKFSKDLNVEFNKILEQSSGVGRQKVFSKTKAALRGKNKGKFKFFIPYSAEDFNGLMYAILPKGKKGEEAYDFLKKALIDPYARGYRDLNAAKQTIANDYKALRKAMPDVRKKLTKKIPNKKDFRYADAVRVYLWDKSGFDIPGLSETDRKFLVDLVNNDDRLKAYADTLGLISKRPEGYTPPQENWIVTNILGDLQDAVDKVGRKEFLAEWKENKDIIFSPENMNKLEAVYGTKYREALEDMLFRMENGTNRTNGDNKLVNAFMNWTNNSVGAIMFFNTRSATLQTLSSVNFINWGDNNIFKAGLAFANQPQFWKDFAMLFNSDMLKQRRKGLKTDVNHAELTEAVGRSKNPAMAALNYLLQKGFLPTQIADSFAIASGGATFYRNRVNTYLKEGLSQKEAEERAFTDFQEIAEATQQSSRPDFISQQQAAALGRLILAFQNTPMQYMRLTKRSMQDLVNGRGDWKTHVSRILYYGAIQNVIFYALQQGLFALAFDDEEDDEKRAAKEEEKMEKIMNGMLDSILRGIGVGGAVASTIKNMIIKIGEEDEKDWNSDFDNVVIEGLQLSPPIGSKVRKARSAGRSYKYNKDVIKNMDIDNIDNPVWDVVGNVVSFSTNVPLDRYVNKHRNIKDALDDQNEAWQRVALMLGWNRWGLDMGKPDEVELVKTELKQKKQEQRKQKEKVKREEKKKEKEKENETVIEDNKEKSKKDGICSAVSKSGKRCGNSVVPGKLFCTVHEKVEQRAGGEKSQCKKIKGDGKRCKMQTSNKSGYCYYHD